MTLPGYWLMKTSAFKYMQKAYDDNLICCQEEGFIIAITASTGYPVKQTDELMPGILQTDETCFDILACDKLVAKEIRTLVPVSIKPTVITQKPTVLCLGNVKVQQGTGVRQKSWLTRKKC